MENLVQFVSKNLEQGAEPFKGIADAGQATVNFSAIMPSMVLTCFGLLLLMVVAFSPKGKSGPVAGLSLFALAVTGALSIAGWNSTEIGFVGTVALDNFATFFSLIFLLAAGLTILMSGDYLKREGCTITEYYPIIIFVTAGAMWMASGTELITIFLGLEVLSIGLYILAGIFRNNLKSNEAGLKYFLLGAFSTGFLLYGIALTYGATGTTRLAGIASYISANGDVTSSPLLLAGMVLMAVGFLFKVGAAPFHMWTPDVYQGAPTPITAFMSAGPKAAALAAFIRVFMLGLEGMKVDWSMLFWIVAVLTMIVGNFMAIQQTNLKRMLAYSSIAHAGYALVGLVAANAIGMSGILFYMLVYTFMNIGAFGVLVLIGKKGEENLTLDGVAGMGYKSPVLAVVFSIFLFALMGIPPTAGFTGKFYIFAGAVESGYIWLAIIGVLNSAVSLYYYLRVMVSMYFRPGTEDFSWIKPGAAITVSLVIALAGVLYLGILPGAVMEMAKLAAF